MSTKKKDLIEKKWKITRWSYDPKTKEVSMVETARTKPITLRRARAMAKEDTVGQNACWMIERGK